MKIFDKLIKKLLVRFFQERLEQLYKEKMANIVDYSITRYVDMQEYDRDPRVVVYMKRKMVQDMADRMYADGLFKFKEDDDKSHFAKNIKCKIRVSKQ